MGARSRKNSHKNDHRTSANKDKTTNHLSIQKSLPIGYKTFGKQSSEKKESYSGNLLGPWSPKAATAFKVILSARLCAAVWSNISDCDETYNYWEISHFLIHGKGFQTWEYSPLYAIRSYFYIWIYTFPALLYSSFLQANKLLVFYYTRCLLAFSCALCETYFYKGVLKQFGPNVARHTLLFMVVSSGMFISSTAFLPSTFSMYMILLAFGAWLQQHYRIQIFTTALSALIGWPFSLIVCLPISFDLFSFKKKRVYFIKCSLIIGLSIGLPLVAVDSYYYGKLVIAPLNIILYNVFSQHGANLYGTEPWSYYLSNCFLNFNLVFIGSLFVIPIMVLCKYTIKSKRATINSSHWICMISLYMWYITFTIQAHKEERFIFPVYPLICLSTAILFDLSNKFVNYLMPKLSYIFSMKTIAFMVIFTVLSLSRSLMLYKGYHGAMDTFMEIGHIDIDYNISKLDEQVNLCLGKEWYRFPNSFFLPSNNKWNVQFIRSNFGGQLPKPYDSSVEFPTRVIPKDMNAENRQEPSRLIDAKECHFIIDTDLPDSSEHDYAYSKDKDNWEIISSYKFLDKDNSPNIWRAFYLPFVTEFKCNFISYNLLKNKHMLINSTLNSI